MATYPTTQADFVAALTDADFLNGGHRTNFIPSLLAALAFVDFSKLTADEIVLLAAQVAADAASAAAGSGTEASAANIRTGLSAQYLSIRRVYDAAAPVTLTPVGGAVAVDMNTGFNFQVDALTGDVVVSNPTNAIAGKSGLIEFVQDATGGREATFASNWKFAGDGGTIGSAPNERSVVAYYVSSPSRILCTVAAGFE